MSGPGLSSWSTYSALQRVSPSDLVDQIVQGLLAAPGDDGGGGGGVLQARAVLHPALGAQVGGQRHVLGDDALQRGLAGLAGVGVFRLVDQDHVLHRDLPFRIWVEGPLHQVARRRARSTLVQRKPQSVMRRKGAERRKPVAS